MNNNDLLYELYYKMIDIDNSLLDVIENFNGLNKTIDESFIINKKGLYYGKLGAQLNNIKNIDKECKTICNDVRSKI